MKLSAILLSTIVGSSVAFHVSFTSSKPRQSVLKHGSPLFESTFDVEVASTTSAKEDLMETAQSLKDEFDQQFLFVCEFYKDDIIPDDLRSQLVIFGNSFQSIPDKENLHHLLFLTSKISLQTYLLLKKTY